MVNWDNSRSFARPHLEGGRAAFGRNTGSGVVSGHGSWEKEATPTSQILEVAFIPSITLYDIGDLVAVDAELNWWAGP